MLIFEKVDQIQAHLLNYTPSESIGFVPTMGALHQGHISLIQQAKQENSIVVCSIFVNPIQFNNPNDLLKYPRTFDEDVNLLEKAGCDILFFPSEAEMYPKLDETKYDFGHLEVVMEGKSRPGHFRGVAVVVRRLFEIIKPHKSYFGKKDFQQLKIVESLVKQYNLSPEIIPCEIIREFDGLAMSSRNMRLTAKQRTEAPLIYQTLKNSVLLAKSLPICEIIEYVVNTINRSDLMKVEYFEIADGDSLMPIYHWHESKNPMGFIVVNLGEIRLIDNINFIL